MHVHFLDPYQERSSPIHALDARVKLVLALAFILAAALAPSGAWPLYILLLALVVSVEILSELGVANILRRAALALPFVLAALPVIFTIDGPPLLRIPLGPWAPIVTAPGLERFVSVALKSWISVQIAIVLAATTRFPDLMLAMRALKTPRLLVAIFGLMWRYLFVLVDEAVRLMRARQSRSGEAEQPGLRTGGGLAWRAQITGGMAGSLFLRAIERSDRIYTAMLSRGYDGEVRSTPLPRLNAPNRAILVAGLALFLILLALGILF